MPAQIPSGWSPQIIGDVVAVSRDGYIDVLPVGVADAVREVRGQVTIINAWAVAEPPIAKGQPYRDEDVRIVCTACALPIVCCADCGRRFRSGESIGTYGCYVEQLVIQGSSREGIYQTHLTSSGDVETIKTINVSVADAAPKTSSWWRRLLKTLHLASPLPQTRTTKMVAVPNRPHRCAHCAGHAP